MKTTLSVSLLLLLDITALQAQHAPLSPSEELLSRVFKSHEPEPQDRHASVWESAFPVADAFSKPPNDPEPSQDDDAAVAIAGGKSTTIDLLLDSPHFSLEYYGEISIGTPPQTFRMALSMLYTTVWIPNFHYGAKNRYYNHSQSSTYTPNGTAYIIPGFLGGFLSQDVMRVGDLEIPNQGFAEINAISGTLPADKYPVYDGFFGLGFDFRRNPSQITMPFHALVDSGVLAQPLFALYFNRKAGNGALNIGATDSSHYKGKLVYADVIRQDSWTVKFDDIVVQGAKVTKHRRAMFWAEWPGFLGPPDEVAALAQVVGAKRVNMRYTIDCNAPGPDIEIRVGGATFSFSKDEYTLRERDGDTCVWAVQSAFASIDAWVFGQRFIENVYTVFNWGDASGDSPRRMGFARRA
ncbi:hypothetical protein Gpo141_00013414 [Globisporangium polare]